MKQRFGPSLVALLLSAALAWGCAESSESPPAYHEAPGPAAFLPARVRRLTNAEYDRTVTALLGVESHASQEFSEDIRQSGFTANAEQTVAGVFASQLQQAARGLAEQAVAARLAELAPCSDPDPEACAARFIASFGRRAYRRPLQPDEQRALLDVYRSGTERDGYPGGIALLLETMLQSPHLLYLTELGSPRRSDAAPRSGEVVHLDAYEQAASLAYLVTGGPPDEALLAAAERGELGAAERERHFWRLLGESSTRFHFRRFVREWLGMDRLAFLARDAELYPDYTRLRPLMVDETDRFVDEVLTREGASFTAFITSGFSVPHPELARAYGAQPGAEPARFSSPDRVGILQQASFLVAHAHESESAPVLRGLAVLERVLCQRLPRPQELDIVVTRPEPDPGRTTRERYAVHAEAAACQNCHASLDGVGFLFENFDAMGMSRTEENGRPVVTRSIYDGREFADSVELARWIAEQPAAKQCFARQALRWMLADTDAALETRFLGLVDTLPEAQRENLFELMALLVQSDLFVKRVIP